jgi:hypothetical protein
MPDLIASSVKKPLRDDGYDEHGESYQSSNQNTKAAHLSNPSRSTDSDPSSLLVVSVAPVFIGDGIPLLARRHRHVPLDLQSVERFEDGVVQLHYRVGSVLV